MPVLLSMKVTQFEADTVKRFEAKVKIYGDLMTAGIRVNVNGIEADFNPVRYTNFSGGYEARRYSQAIRKDFPYINEYGIKVLFCLLPTRVTCIPMWILKL